MSGGIDEPRTMGDSRRCLLWIVARRSESVADLRDVTLNPQLGR